MSLYYGKKKIPNANVVGSPTIDDGVVSGFSTGNYLTLPNAFNPNSNTWEIVIKTTTPSSHSNSQVFFDSTNGSSVIRAVSIYFARGVGTFAYCLTGNTSNYDIADNITGSNVLDFSKTYYVKLIFDGTSYKSYISTDGADWKLDFSVMSSTKVYNATDCRLGYFACNTSLYYQGSIDLNESYIKINGETWWEGTKYTSNKIRDNVSGVYIGAGKTNCLTHIPEDIKLELNSGTLTLKAGSKVYIPNGVTEKKYYKYTYETFAQPVLSSNGTMGGSSFAVSATKVSESRQPYLAFDGNSSTYWQAHSANGQSLTFYNPKPLNVTRLAFTYYDNSQQYAIRSGILYGSNDNSSWETIKSFTSYTTTWGVSENTKSYKYYRIYVVTGGSWEYVVDIKNIAITARVQTGVIESTADDYDYMIPSGDRVFDEVVIETDITLQSGSNWSKGVYLLTYDLTNNAIGQAPLSESISGTVEPSNKSACFWYDTANNLVKEYKSSTLTNAKHSLPIAVTNNPNGSQFTTIDQVFNGMGYIGSTVFALPKVKGLIPDGWEGIHYKNIEFGLDKVVTFTSTATESSVLNIYDGAIGIDIATYTSSNFFKQSNAPNAYQYMLWFDTKENIMKYTEDNGLTWIKVNLFNCADLATSSGKVTSFTPKTVKTTNDVVPIGVICKGSQVVYALPNLADIEKSSAGTYTFTPVVSGLYEITLVGGGGGGAFNSSSNRSSASSGSSGTACQVRAYLTGNKTYTVTVGSGGARSGWLDANTTGGSGGVSTLKVDGTTLISATGGIGGTVWWPNGSSASGQPAAASVAANNDYFTVESVVFNTRGNSGDTGTHGGGASVYNGYGKGGSSTNAGGSSNASNGGTGYARIKLA